MPLSFEVRIGRILVILGEFVVGNGRAKKDRFFASLGGGSEARCC